MADGAPAWTLREASTVLTPPVTHEQLRLIIRALEWKPSGYRHNGRSGRPAPTYPIGELQRLHAALTRWLA